MKKITLKTGETVFLIENVEDYVDVNVKTIKINFKKDINEDEKEFYRGQWEFIDEPLIITNWEKEETPVYKYIKEQDILQEIL